MVFQRIDPANASETELTRICEMLFSVGQRSQFARVKRECQLFAVYDGGVLQAAAAVNPDCPYFGGSILITRIGLSWEYNTEAFFKDLFHALVSCYVDSPWEIICMDIDRRREMNRDFYKALGFRESIMDSPISSNHAVLVAKLADLKNKTEISLDNKSGIC